MSGNPLSDFNDFVEGTGSVKVTGPKHFVMEGVKNTYYFGRLLDPDVAATKHLRGGKDIRENIAFQDNGTWEKYQPGASHDWVNPQRLDRVQLHWRFGMAHMAWTEQEIILNDAIMVGDDGARFQQFVDIRNEKEALMWSAKWNGLETDLWKQPNASTMEGEGAGLIDTYSIFAFINSEANGLFGQVTGGALEFTTLETIDPTAASVDGRFTPQQLTYSSIAAGDPGNVLSVFDEMFQDVSFEQPRTMAQYWEPGRLNKQMIVTSKRGRAHYMFLLREGQDHFVAGQQDPSYPDPQYNGIPVARASDMETALLYDDDASGYTFEEDAGTAGDNNAPRYVWMNGNYLFPVFHPERYFYKHEVTKHHEVPDTWVCPVATWYNIMCTSRQRQGIVFPANPLALP